MSVPRMFIFLTVLTLAATWPAASGAGTIKIGVAGAHSGDLASYGLPTLKAAQLVVRDVNDQGGINGTPLELLIEDDACKPEIAINTATKLVSGGVQAVIGHICSGATRAALPVYRAAKVLVISPSATTPELTRGGEIGRAHV